MRQTDIFEFLEEEEKQLPLFQFSQRVQVRKAAQTDEAETMAILLSHGGSVGVVTDVYFSTYYREHCYGLYIAKEDSIIFFRESDLVGGNRK